MKRKIAVLFGGVSSEYEVSLQSAASVISAIQEEVIMVGIDQHDGTWYWHEGGVEEIADGSWRKQASIRLYPSMNKGEHGFVYWKDNERKFLTVDVALPILHGKNGEDGTVQGVLELCGIEVIGCGVLSSALCMDKVRADMLVSSAGIAVARHIVLQDEEEVETKLAEIRNLGFPLFIKPVKSGSSFGITCIQEEGELREAVQRAFAYDNTVIVEEKIEGVEIGCAVMGRKGLVTGVPDEIVLSTDFFDYEEKYTLKTSKILVPAEISDEKKQEIQEKAKVVYRLLDCRDFARVDFFLKEDGTVYFNEVNTIPGFTSHSRFPKMMCETGLAFEEVIAKLLEVE